MIMCFEDIYHFLVPLTLPFTLPFTLLFTLPWTLPFTLPLTELALSSYFLVRVGSYGSTTSLITYSGVFQKKIAPYEPTEMIVL